MRALKLYVVITFIELYINLHCKVLRPWLGWKVVAVVDRFE